MAAAAAGMQERLSEILDSMPCSWAFTSFLTAAEMEAVAGSEVVMVAVVVAVVVAAAVVAAVLRGQAMGALKLRRVTWIRYVVMFCCGKVLAAHVHGGTR